MQKIEIKIKIDRDKLEDLEKRFDLDYSSAHWIFERTYGFFSDISREQGIFPRVKVKSDSCVAGVKIKNQEDKSYFVREEYEFEMNESDAIKMWKALGFTKVRIFEKLRKKYRYINCEICLDKLPFGIYIEIEGSKENIEEVVKDLKLSKNERITKAYLKLADELGLENAVFKGDEIES